MVIHFCPSYYVLPTPGPGWVRPCYIQKDDLNDMKNIQNLSRLRPVWRNSGWLFYIFRNNPGYFIKLTRKVDPWGMGFWRNQWWGSRKLFRYLKNVWKHVYWTGLPKSSSYLPAPDPATPTVAAPAPMNLAAVSISRLATETESGL